MSITEQTLEMTDNFVTSMNPIPDAYNKLYNSTNSWNEADSLLDLALGILNHTWPHQIEMTE